MTDTEGLKDLIRSKGLKFGYVAKYLGISRAGFDLKINNKSEFKSSEIEAMCELLDISLADKERIFFAKECDLKSQ